LAGLAFALLTFALSACVGPDLEPPKPNASIDARDDGTPKLADAGIDFGRNSSAGGTRGLAAAAGGGGARAQVGTTTPNPMSGEPEHAADADKNADEGADAGTADAGH
jgi:hypothetical protein